MMRSLFSGVSGLKSHQTRMDVIGNNISNINTVGFKSSRTTFADMLSQTSKGAAKPSSTLGGTNPMQIGLGTAVASIDLITNDGSPQSTGKNTDVALSGNGMFVLKRGDAYYYSRDGAFEFDNDGNYVLPGSGLYVQGWNAVDGSLNTNSDPTNIVVPAGRAMPATATSQVDFNGNLNASALTIESMTITAASGGDSSTVVTTSGTSVTSVNVDGDNVISARLTMSDGSTMTVTSGYYEVGHSVPVTTIVTVYDSEGKTHAVTMLMDKSPGATAADSETTVGDTTVSNDNRWRIYLAPEEGTKGPADSAYTGRLTTSEADGSTTEIGFSGTNVTDSSTMAYSYIYFNDDGSLSTINASGALQLTYTDGNGAATTTSSVGFDGLTQYSGNSTAYPTADGNKFGVLQSISIDTSGVLTGTYTNGVLRFEAQIAVAQFVNPAGLTKTGTSLYQQSNNSGVANIKTVTDLGLSITPSALEMSNVDLASELADMIVTQRGFQSNSKVITVGDEMLETLVNMKR